MEKPPRSVLVVDDDPDLALFVKTLLERRADCVVRVAADGLAALAAIEELDPDLVVTDIEMPGLSGLELLDEIRARTSWTPVIVVTAHVSVDYAVAALRRQADELLTKPLDSAKLVEAVIRLADEGRERREASRRREVVLAIGAHPDDVEIGVGGTLAAHRAAGADITILTLSRGSRGGDADLRQHESLDAAELLGARLFLKDLVDTEIGGDGPTVRLIEEVVREVAPTIVYTHSEHDRHQDHRAVHEATIVATRRIRTVACYQSPSATIDFRPTRFVSIDGFLERKLELIDCFRTQTGSRDYLDPEFVRATARYWSRFGAGTSVEPLEVVRESAELARVAAPLTVER
jgi:LmbE family N-acetylglucosaminyl deacetylase/CheY-like chemotaxis protein